jgi:hypothetical protein
MVKLFLRNPLAAQRLFFARHSGEPRIKPGAGAGIQSNNRIIQIQPIRILAFDQFQFPSSFPIL